MHGGDLGHVWPGEDAEGDVDHLQVLGARGRGDLARPRPNVVNHRILEPGDPKVEALREDIVLDAAQAGEDDGAVATVNCNSHTSVSSTGQ